MAYDELHEKKIDGVRTASNYPKGSVRASEGVVYCKSSYEQVSATRLFGAIQCRPLVDHASRRNDTTRYCLTAKLTFFYKASAQMLKIASLAINNFSPSVSIDHYFEL